MTAFTVCWLPFFILALLRPFSHSVYNIPPWIVSFALWLGYANSMLNPIIYVTFHQDFRKAFKYLLCFQCSTMGTRLRQEAYQSQFGSRGGGNNNNNYTTTSISYQYPSQTGVVTSSSARGSIPEAVNNSYLASSDQSSLPSSGRRPTSSSVAASTSPSVPSSRFSLLLKKKYPKTKDGFKKEKNKGSGSNSRRSSGGKRRSTTSSIITGTGASFDIKDIPCTQIS